MLSLVFAAALAAAAPQAAPGRGAGASADPLVCHVEAIPGSRITHRICMRESEAARRKLEARWLLDRAQAASETPRMATLVPMSPTTR